jgi:hypothetical protein
MELFAERRAFVWGFIKMDFSVRASSSKLATYPPQTLTSNGIDPLCEKNEAQISFHFTSHLRYYAVLSNDQNNYADN